jgi:WD40 repeat protein
MHFLTHTNTHTHTRTHTNTGSEPLFRLAAHDKPTCAMSFCPSVPGLLATAATDKKTKLWDVSGGAPSLIASQDLQVGLDRVLDRAHVRPHVCTKHTRTYTVTQTHTHIHTHTHTRTYTHVAWLIHTVFWGKCSRGYPCSPPQLQHSKSCLLYLNGSCCYLGFIDRRNTCVQRICGYLQWLWKFKEATFLVWKHALLVMPLQQLVNMRGRRKFRRGNHLRLLQVGAVFTMGFSADAPHLLAVGGAMGSVIVWDVRANQDVTRRFPQLLPQQQQQ